MNGEKKLKLCLHHEGIVLKECHKIMYWSNSKTTPILYNYNTEYTTKRKHSAEWYDVAINSRMKICSPLVKF